MIGGFRKSSKRGNLRKKIETVDESDEENEEGEAVDSPVQPALPEPPAASANKPTKQKQPKKSTAALSFGDELENADEFVIKRSKASLNMNESLKRDKKKKKKKKENADDVNENVKTEEEEESSIPIGRSSYEPMMIKTFNEDELEGETDAMHRFSSSRLSAPGNIPDAATIYAIKKQREQAMQFGNRNYIPLSNVSKFEGRFSTSNSRLIREDMEGDSSDDENRMEMKGKKTTNAALERRKEVAKALEEVEDVGMDEEMEQQDEELKLWENEQIRKGSHIPTAVAEKYGPKMPDRSCGTSACSNAGNGFQDLMNLPGSYSIPNNNTKSVSVDYVMKRLSEQLDTKLQLHRIHSQEFEKTKFDLDSSKNNIVTLEERSEESSEKFSFYQDIRGFVKDLLECLSEKVKTVNKLEASIHQTWKKRNELIMGRRLNDVKDEIEEVSGKTNTDSERVTNIKNRRIAERNARRARRKEKRRSVGEEEIHNEGMSSDDELIPSDVSRFAAEKEKILREKEAIFEDVVDDFSTIKKILSRFEMWKFGFNDSYKEAYLSLCMPKLFSPFIKLELLEWNPLENMENYKDFEEMQWFHALAMYGDIDGKIEEEDEDIQILPKIIEKVLIHKLTVIVEDAWDPLSEQQTNLLTFLFQRLVDDYPSVTTESKPIQKLVETIVSKLKKAVDEEIFIPLYPRSVLEAKNSSALAFLNRQFWKGVKLLENLMQWNWLLSQKKLQQLGVDAVLNRYLIIALQQFPDPISSFEKTKYIVNIIPKEWFEKSDNIVAGLECVARYLTGLATAAYKSTLGFNDEIHLKKIKLTIKKITSLLMHIQAFDEARIVAGNFKESVKKDGSATLDSPSL